PQLQQVFEYWRRRLEETIDTPSLHEVLSHEPSEDQEAVDAVLQGVSHAQEKEGDQGNSDLNTYGILRGAEEVADFEGVLDPSKEQFDLPTALVEFSDLVGRRIEIVADDAQDFACLGTNPDLAYRVLERVLAGLCLP
ncbi:hypothetical protein KXW36_001707, partial [Aspergillus fumigatus]